MASLEMPANGEASHNVGEDIIHKALDSVEDRLQKVSFLYVISYEMTDCDKRCSIRRPLWNHIISTAAFTCLFISYL